TTSLERRRLADRDDLHRGARAGGYALQARRPARSRSAVGGATATGARLGGTDPDAARGLGRLSSSAKGAGDMSDRHILAWDLGTSGAKAAITTLHGELLGHAFEPTRQIIVPGGGAEQDPDDWWRALGA